MGNTLRKNVFIVGAGASKEFGLPTGKELAEDIADIADIRFDVFGSRLQHGNYDIVETLKDICKGDPQKDINSYLHAAWCIRDNMPLAPSIDNFLDTHQGDDQLVTFGKIAIVHAIQKAEAASKLAVNSDTEIPRLDVSQLSDTWLVQLFKILVAQRNFEAFLEALREITFISFNYDRCIHQFFHWAAGSYFSLNDPERKLVLQSLNVVYPYGSVGEFRCQPSHRTNFGKIDYRDSLIHAASEIKTFTEGADSDVRQEISKSISTAETIVFLGFGFLPLNMDLLFSGRKSPKKVVIGTGKGLSESSVKEVTKELFAVFPDDAEVLPQLGNRIEICDLTCGELFYEYQRFLTK